ncbi:glycosyltransferase family 2 protein, partial [Campylobacter jejuni]|nr:glycosyltransferase family 2 protein [Campylobacter jejuni]
ILNQNYKDKKKSNELIRRLSMDFKNDNFHEKLFSVLEKEEMSLKNRN